MPHIDSRGVVHRERPMEYGDYVRFLRKGFISATGMAESEALLYAGQSARSGAASEAASSGMEPHRICHLAGVRDINCSSPTCGITPRTRCAPPGHWGSRHSTSRSSSPRPLQGLCP